MQKNTDTPLYDLTGMRCPQPLLTLARLVRQAHTPAHFLLKVDDPAAWGDIRAWCQVHQHRAELHSASHLHSPYQIAIAMHAGREA